MTRFSKPLAIFVTVASLAFMGFAIATTFGGPDWQAVTQDTAFRGYKMTRSGSAWTAVRASDESTVATSQRLPEVLAKVLDDIHQRQQQEIQNLSTRESALAQRVEQLKTAIPVDTEALRRYQEEHRQQLAQIRQEESRVATQVIAATAESQKLENQIAARREDVIRVRQQVEELKADQYRLEEIRAQLENLKTQLESNLAQAQQREQSLKQRLPESAP